MHSGRVNNYYLSQSIHDLPWHNLWSADNPVEVLNEHLLLLVGRFVPTKVIRVRVKDKSWFNDLCRHAFGLKPETHLWWTRARSRVTCRKSLSAVKFELMKTTQRLSVSFVSVTGMFL